MVKGPFPDWGAAVRFCCIERDLMIVHHDWKDGELYVETVPVPRPRRFQ